MTRGQATPIVMTKSDGPGWSTWLVQKVLQLPGHLDANPAMPFFKGTDRTAKPNNFDQSSDMTASARGVNLATTRQLSDTIFSSR